MNLWNTLASGKFVLCDNKVIHGPYLKANQGQCTGRACQGHKSNTRHEELGISLSSCLTDVRLGVQSVA